MFTKKDRFGELYPSLAHVWKLIRLRKYEDALTKINDELAHTRSDFFANHAARAVCMLCTKDFDGARDEFLTADRDFKIRNGAFGADFRSNAAICELMHGKAQESLSRLVALCDAIQAGEPCYTDVCGGIMPGLLRRYVATRINRVDEISSADLYLEKLLAATDHKFWPAPLALVAMGKMSMELVIKSMSRKLGWHRIFHLNQPLNPKVFDERQALLRFYQGGNLLADNDVVGAQKLFKIVLSSGDKPGLIEWHLAEWELRNTENVL